MKIYTKQGDEGKTSLVGGTRVKKYDKRIEAYGTIDELNSFIGMILNFKIKEREKKLINFIQNKLFNIGSILATEKQQLQLKSSQVLKIKESDISYLEKSIDDLYKDLPILKSFIIPVGSELISWCNISRTVCRRAERRIIELEDNCDEHKNIIVFMNRLSDLLFVMARKYAKDDNVDEILWHNDL